MTSQGTGSRPPKAIWHKSTVHTFCDVCIVAIEKMFRPHTHFNKQGWDFITNEFRTKTGLCYDQKQLKTKWDALKKEFKLWKDLMRTETGLGWDPHKMTVGADDAWWEEKIKINPSFANLKISGIEPELEHKLEVMFNTIISTGEFAMAPGCDVQDAPREPAADVEGCGDSEERVHLDQTLDDCFEGEDSQGDLPRNRKRSVGSQGRGNSNVGVKKGKRQTGGATMLARHLDTLVGAVASRSSTVNSNVTAPHVPTLRDVVADLKTLRGLDIGEEMFMWATEFLENKMKREVYMELDSAELKMNWLNYHFTRKGSL